jgi:hypothetical protein
VAATRAMVSPGLISSFPGTVRLLPSICFSRSCPELELPDGGHRVVVRLNRMARMSRFSKTGAAVMKGTLEGIAARGLFKRSAVVVTKSSSVNGWITKSS